MRRGMRGISLNFWVTRDREYGAVNIGIPMQRPEIKTEYVYPPIPRRQFDWRATYGDYDLDDPMGWGATEQEAIDDLILNHPHNGDR